MIARFVKAERIETPEEFNEQLKQLFGVNEFGDALFRVVWGQTETYDVAGRRGYEQRLVGHNKPCWIIQRWRPPELFGTPDLYYKFTADEETGLALLGEYPQFGQYETVVMLMSEAYDEERKELVVKTIPLDFDVLEKAIPLLEAAERMTAEERKAAIEAIAVQENTERVNAIAERLEEELPRFYNPVSYRDQLNRTSLIDRKVAETERQWKIAAANLKLPPRRGFYQGS